ncbi:hypothetical protein MOF34_12435 [Bacillus sp. T17B1]|uniref:DUF6773 family protein n=1 Tax=unclassified Bacillus (in: firmicutes) TaxID=185979 RepID=UPI00227E021C|nr:DUF6773 family protein [Bacillus sp. C28GYM-DRY-1]MCY9375929.1 hypothetical protein [Bacillus sp. T17B1]MDO3660871.1 hypothetical protein [Bacillus sp. C28GYM-DRY-1]
MNRFLSLFGESKTEDERLQGIQYKVLARSGAIVFILALLDIIIRGGIFHKPYQEWVSSLVIFVIYLIWSFFDSLFSGVLYPNLQTKQDFKARLRKSFKEIIIPPIFVAVISCFKFGFPTDALFYIKLLFIFIGITALLFIISYLIILITWKRNLKNTDI